MPPTSCITSPDASPTLLSECTPISQNYLLDIVSHILVWHWHSTPQIFQRGIRSHCPLSSLYCKWISVLQFVPRLFQTSLDPAFPHNYRPISKSSFVSKIIEKAVAKQLLEIVEANDIPDPFQSGFHQLHSTETALLKVTNDMLINADSGHHSILVCTGSA